MESYKKVSLNEKCSTAGLIGGIYREIKYQNIDQRYTPIPDKASIRCKFIYPYFV